MIIKFIKYLIVKLNNLFRSNSLRLWMPQLFSMIETYTAAHPTPVSGRAPTICEMLDSSNYFNFSRPNNTSNSVPECTEVRDAIFL